VTSNNPRGPPLVPRWSQGEPEWSYVVLKASKVAKRVSRVQTVLSGLANHTVMHLHGSLACRRHAIRLVQQARAYGAADATRIGNVAMAVDYGSVVGAVSMGLVAVNVTMFVCLLLFPGNNARLHPGCSRLAAQACCGTARWSTSAASADLPRDGIQLPAKGSDSKHWCVLRKPLPHSGVPCKPQLHAGAPHRTNQAAGTTRFDVNVPSTA